MTEVIVATNNKGKFREIQEALKDLPLKLVPLWELPEPIKIVEDGNTYEENALKKAREVAKRTGKLSIADDSGLEVEPLGGAPGIHSAHYAGEGATDRENNRKLLEALRGLPLERRKATFRCFIAAVDPVTGWEKVVQGRCEGLILEEERGNNGFGYDPLFFVPERGKTLAEMSLEEKNSLSHRGRALQTLRDVLKSYLSGRGAAW